jgi:SAM-dependent methyltransferase
VHQQVIDRVRARLGTGPPSDRAPDIGCEAGLSTAPLRRLSSTCLGIDPVEAMLRQGSTTALGVLFTVARAEALPVRSGSVDIVTAAGSLNYVDLDRFFPEVARVLSAGGTLVVYDFDPGRSFRDSPALDDWFAEWVRRYPAPAGYGNAVSPESLARGASAFSLSGHEHFEVGLTLDPDFYVGYAMTGTNIYHAIACGQRPADMRKWCEESLRPVFSGEPREVLFRGYVAYLGVDI